MHKVTLVLLLAFAVLSAGCDTSGETENHKSFKVMKTEEEWKNELSPMQYQVLRQKGTERAFTGQYWDNHEKGTYYCAGCHQTLFKSDTKFESGTGWPSFYKPITDSAVAVLKDRSHGMIRDEVVCSNCGGHLGHVFPDGLLPRA